MLMLILIFCPLLKLPCFRKARSVYTCEYGNGDGRIRGFVLLCWLPSNGNGNDTFTVRPSFGFHVTDILPDPFLSP